MKHGIAMKMILALGVFGIAHAAYAGNRCPQAVVDRVDNPVLVTEGGTGYGPTDEFGTPTSAETTCIKKTNNVDVVVALNSNDVHRSGNGQQVINIRNLMNDYDSSYGMVSGKNYEVVVVAYGAGGRWVLNDDAYDADYGGNNPSAALVESLLERGAKVYMCQNTMKGNQWVAADLIDGVEMVPAGVTALVDFQMQGYTYLNP